MRGSYDVVVIGGGHAGAEAAWIASVLGMDVCLVTMAHQAIGRMSCNPAIGGLGKGQIVREIDALGGIMGLAADRAGIQFRMLNRSKGPAVWAPRAQADRQAYPQALQELLGRARSLDVVEGVVGEILVRASAGASNARAQSVKGVVLEDGRGILARAIVLTTGTFLRGITHCGCEQVAAGRLGEPAADRLSDSLRSLGFELGRLKTGTPPRVHRDTVDYNACQEQPGDEVPTPFSMMTSAISQPQVCCWTTWTNARVHEQIRANLHRAPLYSGQIESVGPRYCPSIEDKIVRFADKPKHQIFLEPEGADDERLYCNGVATSLPRDVQDAFVREVPGLRHASILQYGYAIEYDWVPTHQIDSSLETKLVEGLFLAGQINGTSGYEEAAGQGLIAGINAVQRLTARPPLILGRDEAYIGVMIDDLIARPPCEPYRMFTSRAEYRLRLRADNADQRLTPIGRRLGTVDDARWDLLQRKLKALAHIGRVCDKGNIDGVPLKTWLRRPEADVRSLADALQRANGRASFGNSELEQALIEAKYQGYVSRQDRQIERFRKTESLTIPPGVDYRKLGGLRLEARERLSLLTPRTLGQASRISGVTPADISVLAVHLSAGS